MSSRGFVTIKISLDNLWDILFSLEGDDSTKKLYDRLFEIALKKEHEINNKAVN